MTAVVVAEAVAIALLAVLVAGLLRSHAELADVVRHRLPPPSLPAPAAPLGVALGGAAPPIRGVDPGGGDASVDLASAPVLVAFLTGGCRECARWWAALAGAQGRHLGPAVAVVTPDPSTEPAGALRRIVPADLAVVMSSDAWDAYGVQVASTFVLVTDGVVRAAGRAETWDDLATIVGRAPDLSPGT